MANLQAPRGTYDALPEKSERFAHLENVARHVFGTYGFGEIRTPIFEQADVFLRHVGDSTDIVNKEMYMFEDRGGDKMALRPEGTAGVVRAYYDNGLKQHLPLKLYYAGTAMFRYERPQKGRYRQFHQIGAEFFGVSGPEADVEVIAMGVQFLKKAGVTQDLLVKLNSLGTPEDRADYRKKLLAYFEPHKTRLSKESWERLDVNPLRVLDSKEPEDRELVKNAPRPLDMLSKESQKHFDRVKEGLDALGIAYEIDTGLVRGLDYYTHTVFEIHGEGLGSQSQVIGGGRFDGLIQQMGGDDVPAVGFGCGMERLEMILPELPVKERPVAFVVMGDHAMLPAMQAADKLRDAGIETILPLEQPAFKTQMKRANKMNARHVVIVGEDEVENATFQLKDMDEGSQSAVSLSALVEKLTVA